MCRGRSSPAGYAWRRAPRRIGKGRATPNAQAAALILTMRQYPDTFDQLRSLDSEAA
jgi:hypothetical protein